MAVLGGDRSAAAIRRLQCGPATTGSLYIPGPAPMRLLQCQVGVIGFLFHFDIIPDGIGHMDSLQGVLPAVGQGVEFIDQGAVIDSRRLFRGSLCAGCCHNRGLPGTVPLQPPL